MTMTLALNPIQWQATEDGWLDPALAPDVDSLFAMVKSAGFDAVMAAVPPGMPTTEYAHRAADAGLRLAPGFVSCPVSDPGALTELVLASVVAQTEQQAELGFADTGMGAGGMMRGAPRVVRPAVGAYADEARLAGVIEVLGRVSEAMRAVGVRPNLHPHVGTWIETEKETRTVLDALPADALGFLPDTGHLAWAGADVAGLVADYADRVAFVHVKDYRADIAELGKVNDWTYQETVLHGLWIEPGRGSLDFADVLGRLPESFSGTLMVEVDRPDLEPYESAVASAGWMRSAFRFGA